MRETRRKGFLMITFTLALLLLIIVQVVAPMLTANSDSLPINNSSLESTTKKSNLLGVSYKIPKNWNGEFNASNSISQDQAFDGDNSLKISNGQALTITSNSEVEVVSGTLYRFGVKMFSEEAKLPKVGLTIIESVSGKRTEGLKMAITAPSVWEDAFVEIEIPEGVTKIKLECVIDASGSSKPVYVDAFYANTIESRYCPATLVDGASLRLVVDSPGIRFSAQVQKAYYDFYKGTEMGVIIAPRQYVETAGDFTMESLDKNEKKYLKIVANKLNNTESLEDDGFYGFSCALVKIQEQNITREFCVRAYCIYTIDGKTITQYSDFSYEKNSRSIQQVAQEAKLNLANYTEEEQKIILKYADYVDKAE